MTIKQLKGNLGVLNKTSVLSRIGYLCAVVGSAMQAFKPFELEKHNIMTAVLFLGMGMGFFISHFITLKDSE